MYPVLFDERATDFSTQGEGVLSSAVECTVTEERNGEYELFMRYPQTGVHYDGLKNSAIIACIPSDGGNRQAFRIYKITRPINGIVSVYAQHISYQLSYIPVAPFECHGIVNTFKGFRDNALEACPFTFETDLTSNAAYSQGTPESIRARLGGQQGSVLDVFGGEYEFDNYTVRLWESRGKESGATLRYGKNITDVKQDENIENTYTGIVPYWKSDEDMISLSAIHASTAENFPFQRTIPVDFSANFEEMPTEEQLLSAANAYIRKNKIGIPRVSISVSFVALWQTEEYKGIAPLERVNLCDTVEVYFEQLGISTTAKVNKTTWDVIRERYTSIEIGESRHTLTSVVAETSGEIATTIKTMAAETQKAVNSATKLITGQKGGFVVLHLDPATKKPYEILIMDTDDIDTATKVWRWNAAGWGYSENGYNGPFNLAATMDGAIIADFIKAGTMEADRIKGGTLTLGGEFNGNGVLEVKDDADRIRGRWANDGIRSLWYDPETGMPKDFISINGDAGGVLMIRDVTSNSSIDAPVQSSAGYTIEMYSNAIHFYKRGEGKVGEVWYDGAEFTDSGTGEYSYYTADGCWVAGDIDCEGDLSVRGQKSRAVDTDFGLIALSAYETASPYFGDIGSGVCGEDGKCFVELDARLADVCNMSEYHVFISPYTGASLSVERFPGYFVVAGEPGDTFAWEVKAKQLGFESDRFETKDRDKRDQIEDPDPGEIAANYIIEEQVEATLISESGGTSYDESGDIGNGVPDSGGVEVVDDVLRD